MSIGDCQRIAVDPIARAELAFEIRGPEIIRPNGGRRHDARMMRRAAAPPFPHQPMAREEIARGTDGRPGEAGMPGPEPIQQHPRAPLGMAPLRGEEALGDRFGDLVRTVMRRPTAIRQGRAAPGVVPAHPLIGRLPAYDIPRRQLGHRVHPELIVINTAITFFHG